MNKLDDPSTGEATDTRRRRERDGVRAGSVLPRDTGSLPALLLEGENT